MNVKLTEIPYIGKEGKLDNKKIVYTEGKSKMICYSGRMIVLLDVNGINVPFYLSTGSGGKKNVASGKWYPFFGIGDDGWINKTIEEDINNYYYNPVLKKLAQDIDKKFGDIRNDKTIPLVRDYSGSIHFKYINKGFNPLPHSKSDLANLRAKITEFNKKLYDSVVNSKKEEPNKKEPTSQTKIKSRYPKMSDDEYVSIIKDIKKYIEDFPDKKEFQDIKKEFQSLSNKEADVKYWHKKLYDVFNTRENLIHIKSYKQYILNKGIN